MAFNRAGDCRNPSPNPVRYLLQPKKETAMKGIIAWLLGVPIVVIILLYVTGIF